MNRSGFYKNQIKNLNVNFIKHKNKIDAVTKRIGHNNIFTYLIIKNLLFHENRTQPTLATTKIEAGY